MLKRFFIGIDEVGRGPLAGPVVVCALAISVGLTNNIKLITYNKGYLDSRFRGNDRLPLRDSKKLTKKQREEWVKVLNKLKRDGKIYFEAANVPPETIDKINITKAANGAATMAYKKLLKKLPENAQVEVFLDGGLHLENFQFPRFAESRRARFDLIVESRRAISNFQKKNRTKLLRGGDQQQTPSNLPLKRGRPPIRTIIKGDELIPAISLASIVAKVKRDKLMAKYSKTYPQYGFEKNSGYGTKRHIRAVKRYGLCQLHRVTFCKNITNSIRQPAEQKSKCQMTM